ncbi:MAG: hypothetical protein ACKVRP_05050 [Bacteroidota bacterium]
MRVKQVLGSRFLSDATRRKLESSHFSSVDSARMHLQRCFPNHVISCDGGSIQVANRDQSFTVAAFKRI